MATIVSRQYDIDQIGKDSFPQSCFGFIKEAFEIVCYFVSEDRECYVLSINNDESLTDSGLDDRIKLILPQPDCSDIYQTFH